MLLQVLGFTHVFCTAPAVKMLWLALPSLSGPPWLRTSHSAKILQALHVIADHTSQDVLPSAQPDPSTVATPAAREASSVDVSQDTPSYAVGQPDTSNNQKQNGNAEKVNAANGTTDIDGVSVKELIQRRTSDLGVSAPSAKMRWQKVTRGRAARHVCDLMHACTLLPPIVCCQDAANFRLAFRIFCMV